MDMLDDIQQNKKITEKNIPFKNNLMKNHKSLVV